MNASDKLDPNELEKAAEAAGSGVSDQAKDLATQAVESMRKAVDEMTALLRANAPAAVEALKDARKAAGENISGLAGDARDLAHDARDLGRDRLDDLSVAVRRNPLTWLAVAAGAGLIVGLWNNRGGRE
jgi:ElaB/YqjD/DUF883 family membrane-anchored ribosome-binding protein